MSEELQNNTKIIKEEDIPGLLVPELNHYLLIDCLALTRLSYQPLLADAQISKTSNAKELIRAVDPFTTREFIWDRTVLDEQQEEGPLLISFDQDSALIQQFIKHWAAENIGVLLSSREKLLTIAAHLRSLVTVNLPQGRQPVMNLQDPQKLHNVLAALDDPRYVILAGPIKQMIWYGKVQQTWHLRENTHPQTTEQQAPWFEINVAEMEIINHMIQKTFEYNMTNVMLQYAEQHKTLEESTKLLNANRTDIATLVEKNIISGKQLNIIEPELVERFLKLTIFHQPLLKQSPIHTILNDLNTPADIRLQQIEQQLLQTKSKDALNQ